MPYIYEYPRPAVTVDTVVLRKNDQTIEVLLILRKNDPFKNMWALPGGFVEIDEDPYTSALRELKEETGLSIVFTRPVGFFGDVERDPRSRTISMVYYSLLEEEEANVEADSDALQVEWHDVKKLPGLAFDHNKIIKTAFEVIKRDLMCSRVQSILTLGLSKEQLEDWEAALKLI